MGNMGEGKRVESIQPSFVRILPVVLRTAAAQGIRSGPLRLSMGGNASVLADTGGRSRRGMYRPSLACRRGKALLTPPANLVTLVARRALQRSHFSPFLPETAGRLVSGFRCKLLGQPQDFSRDARERLVQVRRVRRIGIQTVRLRAVVDRR